MEGTRRNPGDLLTSRILVPQGPRDSVFDVESCTQKKASRRMQSQDCQVRWLWHHRSLQEMLQEVRQLPK